MNHIWYLGFYPEAPNHALVDRLTPHLDRCGVSFHVADRQLSLRQQSLDYLQSGCDYLLILPRDNGLSDAEDYARAIVAADGKQWVEETP